MKSLMKKNNLLTKLLLVAFLIFAALYIALESGYYDVKIGRKATITEEKLQEFENDVKEGKEVDLKDYLTDDYIDYSSNVSRFGSKIGSNLDKFLDGGLDGFFNLLGSLF